MRYRGDAFHIRLDILFALLVGGYIGNGTAVEDVLPVHGSGVVLFVDAQVISTGGAAKVTLPVRGVTSSVRYARVAVLGCGFVAGKFVRWISGQLI